MQNLVKHIKKSLKNKANLKNKAIDFINAGVCCNCLVALHEAGILNKLIENEFFDEAHVKNFDNPICINSALVTLEKCRIIKKETGIFKLTEFGRAVLEYTGLITIFFDGYGALVANQSQIVKKKNSCLENLVKWPIVSKSSIDISKKTVDPVIIKEFENLKFSGTICDLGCGHGVMLSKICKKTGNPGLGFESNAKTVSQANEQLPDNISIEVADITDLQSVWEDVVFLMQAFVLHDITPENKCISIINSYLKNFPNLRYFFYVDIVSPSQGKNEIFPGFDYIHGLLGIPTRTYEKTLEMFAQSNYSIFKEVCIPDLPNTFLWILAPKRGI